MTHFTDNMPQPNDTAEQNQIRGTQDTHVPDEIVEQTEGVGYHACKDLDGKIHLIRNPQLDTLKNLMGSSMENAGEYMLYASNSKHRALSFGLCSLALFCLSGAQRVFCGAFDTVDLALGVITLGATAVSIYQSRWYGQMVDYCTNLNAQYSEEYQEKLAEISQGLNTDEHKSMFG